MNHQDFILVLNDIFHYYLREFTVIHLLAWKMLTSKFNHKKFIYFLFHFNGHGPIHFDITFDHTTILYYLLNSKSMQT